MGTAAASVLIGTLDVFWPAFVIDACTFFISFVLISRIAAPPRERASAGAGDAGTILRQLRDGIVLIFQVHALLGALVVAGVIMLGLGAVNVLFVPLLVNDLQVPTTWFGAIELAQTAGMILSGGLVALLAARFAPARIVGASAVALGIGVGLIALAINVWHVIGILFVIGMIVTPLQAAIATLAQTAVSDEVRGRVGPHSTR